MSSSRLCPFGDFEFWRDLWRPNYIPGTQRSCNAPGRCNCGFQSHATLQQRSWALQRLLPEPICAPATLLDAATAASRATHRSCNAPGRCNCCFQGHAALQQRSQTLQLLLRGPRNTAATFPNAATAASRAAQRSERRQARPRSDQEDDR